MFIMIHIKHVGLSWARDLRRYLVVALKFLHIPTRYQEIVRDGLAAFFQSDCADSSIE